MFEKAKLTEKLGYQSDVCKELPDAGRRRFAKSRGQKERDDIV
jgi:hypothetical protein